MDEKKWESILNSLANGVEMRLHVSMGIPDRAIEETRKIACKLSIPDEAIEAWTLEREGQAGQAEQDIESLLTMLRNNAIARDIFSHFIPYEKPGDDSIKFN